ncbi:glycosyltransferase family 2 protein [Labrys miyagiensis]|uniref:glycosyltransferase family 2 protein n=1 Tax=Labrys miyagiensis TaxID=346912 RepID=UPI0024E0886F|nr:glycosyltransferase family 2 protein [Labrys miyagiensis]
MPPYLSIIIPTLDEECHITDLIEQILVNAPPSLIEIIVSDGGSKDQTRQIVRRLGQRDARVRLIDNPKQIQAAGVNAAVAEIDPRARYILRLDAHSSYGDTFVADILNEIVHREVDSVVVRLRSVGQTCFQRAVAYVSNQAIGNGGARHRMGDASGFVDHGHHAIFKRETFVALNGYDEDFDTNEDAEFDHRLRAKGGRIWLAANLPIDYYPRASLTSLAQQYYRYGRGRARNFMKHRQRLRLRQLLPALLFLYCLLILPFGDADPYLVLPLGLYAGVVLLSAVRLLLDYRSLCIVGVLAAIPAMHLAWGCGFVTGCLAKLLAAPAMPVEAPDGSKS